MSAVYKLFRTWPDVVRTNHPHSSVAAWGFHRDQIVKLHNLGERFGNPSPLGVLYDLDAQVLFLGTDFELQHEVSLTKIGEASCRLFSFRTAVDFAVEWLTHQNRT